MPDLVDRSDLQGYMAPVEDGTYTEFANREAETTVLDGKPAPNPFFDPSRKVFFVNGMGNSPSDHVISALELSLVQMCVVGGIYNKSGGFFGDLIECAIDKLQFNGLASPSANLGVKVVRLLAGSTSQEAARQVLSRNASQVTLFNKLREPTNRRAHIFAHSQGNLILSNALQAIAAVDGMQAMAGYTVHTFGSPAVNWPSGIARIDHGFTFDGVSWLAGFDWSMSISKVGMPRDSKNPFTHGFLEYMKLDPQFVVNRFRTGGWGLTFLMDVDGLARTLVEMGSNLKRVLAVFELLDSSYKRHSDDVAVRYVAAIQTQPRILTALKAEPRLVVLLKQILGTGVVLREEQRAIEYLDRLGT